MSEGEKERIQQWLQEIYDKKLLNERQVIRYARKALKNKKISIKYRIGKEAEYTKEMKELSANWAKRKQVDEFAVRTNLERHQKTVERTEESEIKFVQVAIFCDKLVIGHSLAVHITDLSSDVGRATHRIFHSSEIAEELHANPALMLINIYLSNIQNTVCFDFGISHLESEIIDFSNLRKALNGYTYFKSHFSSDISKPIVLLIFRNVYLKKMYLFRWGDRWYFEEPAEILSISRSIVRKTLRLLDKGQRNFGHFIIRKYLRNGKPVILSLRLDNNLFLKYSPIPLLEVVRLVPLVYKFRKSHIIIDLGSGDGTLLKILSKVGFQELIGIEIQVELYRHSVEHLESACEEKIKFINKNVLDFELEPSKKPILFTFFNSFQSELLQDWLLQQSNHIPKNSLLLSINDLTGGTLGPKIVLKSDRRFLFGHRIGIFSISPFTLYEL